MMSPDTQHPLRAVLAGRGLRRLMHVRAGSQFADGMFQAALAGSVLFNPDRQASALAIASGSAVLLLPYSLIGPYVGVFLDRWSRRQVLVWTTVLRALLVLPAALLTWHGRQDGMFVVVALAVIGVNRFFLSAVSAALPHVVDDERLVTANALSGTLGSIAYSAGLATAIVLLKTVLSTGFHGYALVAACAPAGYLAAALLARRSFTVFQLGPDGERCQHAVAASVARVGAGMIDGVRHLASRRGAAYAVAAQAAFRALFGVLALLTLLLYRHYFITNGNVDASISGLAYVFVAGSTGVFLAALVTPAVTRRIDGWRWVGTLIAASAVAVLAGGLPFQAKSLVVGVLVLNLAAQGIKIVVDTTVQHECADDFRGRVFSVNDTTFNISYVVGMFSAALTAPSDGHSPAAVVAVACGYALIAGWYTLAARRWARVHGEEITEPVPSAA
jgi:MFS family permease